MGTGMDSSCNENKAGESSCLARLNSVRQNTDGHAEHEHDEEKETLWGRMVTAMKTIASKHSGVERMTSTEQGNEENNIHEGHEGETAGARARICREFPIECQCYCTHIVLRPPHGFQGNDLINYEERIEDRKNDEHHVEHHVDDEPEVGEPDEPEDEEHEDEKTKEDEEQQEEINYEDNIAAKQGDEHHVKHHVDEHEVEEPDEGEVEEP